MPLTVLMWNTFFYFFAVDSAWGGTRHFLPRLLVRSRARERAKSCAPPPLCQPAPLCQLAPLCHAQDLLADAHLDDCQRLQRLQILSHFLRPPPSYTSVEAAQFAPAKVYFQWLGIYGPSRLGCLCSFIEQYF